ncbi:MAG TPA: YqaA family protein [Paracoccus sp. (in: a-proteobacteria)]|uniref:YqaA family protein n=1 Tax=uncultured Paracoccus sp. TaxID=189685 RepID=UPI0026113919|nr:YqaA family protein [uncultured Paracoccus sp.]HMQ40776.1 YqaA family protein [Paracoccus sp. (in: a-proteobacteria)]HMR37655.1 YqaA family protein [Paracoccus sp. (in: a-proteobacteria)]
MLRRLYDWTMDLAARPYAMWALFAVAFIESSFFPIPPDVLIIPMVLANRPAWLRIALVATLGSVLGGLFGYWIGAALMDSVGQHILAAYGKEADYAALSARFDEWGVWAVLIAGLTPFPFKVITIFSGAVHLNLVVFVLAAIAARATRFFIVAWLLWRYGAPIRDFIEKRLGLIFTLFLVGLIGGFYLVKYL